MCIRDSACAGPKALPGRNRAAAAHRLLAHISGGWMRPNEETNSFIPTSNPERDGDLVGGGAVFNTSPEQVRSPGGLPEVRKHARARGEQASKQAASGSYCGSVACVVRGSRRSQVADAARRVGESADGGDSGQSWLPRHGAPLPEGGRPMGSSASPPEPSLSGRGRPGTCLLYTSPSPRDRTRSRMPSSA